MSIDWKSAVVLENARDQASRSFCMVTTFYPPYHFGGDAMFVYRLANELASRGHRVTVAHCVDAYKSLQPRAPTATFANHPNVTVRRLKSRWGTLSPMVTYLTGKPGPKAPALRALFAREQFDVTHFHNISLIGGPAVLRYGSGVKLYTMHEHWLVCPMHVLWKNNREPCVTPECFKCTLAFRRPPQLWRYSGLMARELPRVDLFLSPSLFTENEHRKRGFTLPIRHLPHFLPVPEASPLSPGTAATTLGRPYFLFVGRLEQIKGLPTLLEVFRRYPQADLVVAGDGESAQAFRQQAADLPHVRFLGHVQPSSLGHLYRNAIALLVPSLCYEVFGLVSLEAFAQRTPVIVHDWGALPECVEQSGGGFTYRTQAELVHAMQRLQQDPALRSELGERGYQGFLRWWSAGPHLDAYFAAIDEAAELHRRREDMCTSQS
ncbi:MAG: glycosyltransferase family 4 protein [Chloroflexota bacterium]